MEFREYQEKAITTSKHKNREVRITCCAFGLMGELTELALHTSNNVEESIIQKECGDFFWYLAVLARELHLEVEKDFFFDVKTDPAIVIGLLQEKLKKILRDRDYDFTADDLASVSVEINLLYNWILFVCKERKYNVSDILNMNLEKLFSRKERGVIGGSGDQR